MKSKWNMRKLDVVPIQIIDGDRGKNYPKHSDFHSDEYCLFLNAANVTRNGFRFEKCQFITQTKDDALGKGKLTRGDIVMTTRGTVGNVALYSTAIPFEHVRINSGMVIFRANHRELSQEFLYQVLRSNYFKRQVKSLRTGAAQPQLPIRDIKTIFIPVPPNRVQTRIAEVLGTYDGLIENNRRRISLLGKIAQELYREWFVRLRFPSHEYTRFIDGIPKGWTRTSLGEFGNLRYGKALRAEDRIAGEYPVYGSSGIVGIHNEAHVQGPGIIVGRKGNVGQVYWANGDFCAIDTVYFVDPSAVSHYVYYALRNVDFSNTDVAVPGLNRTFAHSRKFLWPSDHVRKAFDDVARPIHEQISLLGKQNDRLMQARNLILPRLMDGEVAI